MRRILSLSIAAVLGLAVGACDEQPISPDQQLRASHGATGMIEATATYRAVNSTAADNHDLRVGERIGTLSVTDDGSSLTVEGSASGLDPEGEYESLFYDKASSPQGPEACEPRAGFAPGSDHPLALTLGQMIIGSGGTIALWDVDSEGDATLGPTSTLEYVSADMIGTVSIRDTRVNGGLGPQAVVACGTVTHDPARPNL